MSSNFDRLLQLCTELDQRRADYTVRPARSDTILVSIAVPGEYWEIEFFTDGSLELERFESQGVESRPTALVDVLHYFDD